MHNLNIRRLNLDSSWQIQWGNDSLLIDPWLSGPEIDGFKAFNIQWHTTEPLPYQELDPFSLVCISQPYSDHCHEETLKKLPGDFKVWGVKPSLKKIRKWLPRHTVVEIPDIRDGFLKTGAIEVAKITPNRLIDPIYHALIIKKGTHYLFYCPHGFSLTESQHKALEPYTCVLLISTITRFLLPAVLGGVINPGVENATGLISQLRPEHFINTHDEDKRAEGLVMKLAKVHYAGPKEWQLLENSPTTSHTVTDYAYLRL